MFIYEFAELWLWLSISNIYFTIINFIQDSLDLYNERDPFKSEESTATEEEENEDSENMLDTESEVQERDLMSQPLSALRNHMERVCFPKGLPWAPKVR